MVLYSATAVVGTSATQSDTLRDTGGRAVAGLVTLGPGRAGTAAGTGSAVVLPAATLRGHFTQLRPHLRKQGRW